MHPGAFPSIGFNTPLTRHVLVVALLSTAASATTRPTASAAPSPTGRTAVGAAVGAARGAAMGAAPAATINTLYDDFFGMRQPSGGRRIHRIADDRLDAEPRRCRCLDYPRAAGAAGATGAAQAAGAGRDDGYRSGGRCDASRNES